MSEFKISPDERMEIARQIGQMNILSISGGRITALPDGIELPVSSGYRVRVHLTPMDDYTVERVMVRGSKEFPKGQRTEVYADEVGEAAYYAGMFRSYDETEWPTK
jgi:hypothetical protein